jgi:hypothetical protein
MAVTVGSTSPLPDVYTTPIKPQYRPDLVSSSLGPLPKELRYEAAAGSVAALIDFCVTYPIGELIHRAGNRSIRLFSVQMLQE